MTTSSNTRTNLMNPHQGDYSYEDMLVERLVPSSFGTTTELFYTAYETYIERACLSGSELERIDSDVTEYIRSGTLPLYVHKYASVA